MELRNASVKLPADLHQQIKDELEAKNITMSQFFEMAAKEHFDKEKGGKTMANGRTLAFTVSTTFMRYPLLDRCRRVRTVRSMCSTQICWAPRSVTLAFCSWVNICIQSCLEILT